MLSIETRAVGGHTPRRGGPKRTRTLQRRLHMLAGLVVVAYVYAAPAPDSPLAIGVRWLVLPALVASGVVMWQWPRLRRLARGRRIPT